MGRRRKATVAETRESSERSLILNWQQSLKRKLIEDIDEYDGDDPLFPWIKCFKGVQEAFPPGFIDCHKIPEIAVECQNFLTHCYFMITVTTLKQEMLDFFFGLYEDLIVCG
ncbi:unnamed protein product [Brassica rapa]|uniref:Uncharacterized protein n=2 Tax=Brassica TaxID=3705 RepID=A0A8D9H478_BRACM|nr:unnamed protein product [Brassica napus]CAG7892456.1 unnamed protein product [Brassica rapa]